MRISNSLQTQLQILSAVCFVVIMSAIPIYLITESYERKEQTTQLDIYSRMAEAQVISQITKLHEMLDTESVLGQLHASMLETRDTSELAQRYRQLKQHQLIDSYYVENRSGSIILTDNERLYSRTINKLKLKSGSGPRIFEHGGALIVEDFRQIKSDKQGEVLGFMVFRKQLKITLNSSVLSQGISVAIEPYYLNDLQQIEQRTLLSPIYFKKDYITDQYKSEPTIAAVIKVSSQTADSYKWLSPSALFLMCLWLVIVVLAVAAYLTFIKHLLCQQLKCVKTTLTKVQNNGNYEPIDTCHLHRSLLPIADAFNSLLQHMMETRVSKEHMILEIGQRHRIQQELNTYKNSLVELVKQKTAALEIKNTLLQEEIERRHQLEKSRRALSSTMLSIQDEERKSLSRELHDGVGPTLMTAKMNTQFIQKKVSRGEMPRESDIQSIVTFIQQAVDDIRAVSKGLRPVYYDTANVNEIFNWFAEEFEKTSGLKVNLKLTIEFELAPKAKENVFRIYQEALCNIYKHAQARKIDVSLIVSAAQILLKIADDGIGFDMNAKKGTGLYSIEERAIIVKGEALISSKKGIGTIVQVVIPVGQIDSDNEGKISEHFNS